MGTRVCYIGGPGPASARRTLGAQRIKQRNREGEDISLDYLCKCHKYHEDWISNISNKIILDGKMQTQDLPIGEIVKL